MELEGSLYEDTSLQDWKGPWKMHESLQDWKGPCKKINVCRIGRVLGRRRWVSAGLEGS